MNMIRPIDNWSVEQIKSGQVIVSVASAVKELIENSLDSGATVINVRVNNYAVNGFAVQDNGSGIAPADYNLIARKHATSKLGSFEDLTKVTTLGFRGEALASLCAVAKLSLTTSTGVAGSAGHALSFDHVGDIVDKKTVAAPVGTIVTVTDIFANFPVRRKDFERNHKRQYESLVAMLQAYALISPVTLTLEHVTKDKKKVFTLRSQGTDMLARVACVYGATTAAGLLRIDTASDSVVLNGLISKPNSRALRPSASRQLIYINGRPTSQPKVNKIISEIFKQYDVSGAPFCILNLLIAPDKLDVNISPDKREVMFHNESRVLSELRAKVDEILSGESYTVPKQASTQPAARQQSLLSLNQFSGTGSVIRQTGKSAGKESPSDTVASSSATDNSDSFSETEYTASAPHAAKRRTGLSQHENSSKRRDVGHSGSTAVVTEQKRYSGFVPVSEFSSEPGSTAIEPSELAHRLPLPHDNRSDHLSENGSSDCLSPARAQHAHGHICGHGHDHSAVHAKNLREVSSVAGKSSGSITGSGSSDQEGNPMHAQALNVHTTMPTSIELIRQMRNKSQPQEDHDIRQFAMDGDGVEERLSMTIRKDDFADMRIVGQFNLGFILVVKDSRSSKHSELFIIDQHASDEIYNFERLQSTTVLNRQPLVVPRLLELSAGEELTVINHMDVFENNGFTITVDADAQPGCQCKLAAIPYSKTTVFDEKDVHELIYQVQENPGNKNLKASKLRAMFAMRACRSSIMVGRPLSQKAMKRVVENLGTLYRPWNCPHGRPTLRHITTLR